MNVHEMAQRVPNYPGRKALERALGPLVEPLAKRKSGQTIQRLLGFWTLSATYGGDLLPLASTGVISRAGVYAQRRDFREAFGVDVEDFLPDVAAALYSSGLAVKLGHADKVRTS